MLEECHQAVFPDGKCGTTITLRLERQLAKKLYMLCSSFTQTSMTIVPTLVVSSSQPNHSPLTTHHALLAMTQLQDDRVLPERDSERSDQLRLHRNYRLDRWRDLRRAARSPYFSIFDESLARSSYSPPFFFLFTPRLRMSLQRVSSAHVSLVSLGRARAS